MLKSAGCRSWVASRSVSVLKRYLRSGVMQICFFVVVIKMKTFYRFIATPLELWGAIKGFIQKHIKFSVLFFIQSVCQKIDWQSISFYWSAEAENFSAIQKEEKNVLHLSNRVEMFYLCCAINSYHVSILVWWWEREMEREREECMQRKRDSKPLSSHSGGSHTEHVFYHSLQRWDESFFLYATQK